MKGSQPQVKPQIIEVKPNIELKPNIEVIAPAVDMQPIADAVKEILSKPSEKQEVIVNMPEKEYKPRRIIASVTERDQRNYIKTIEFVEVV